MTDSQTVCCEKPAFCRCIEHGGKCHNCGKERFIKVDAEMFKNMELKVNVQVEPTTESEIKPATPLSGWEERLRLAISGTPRFYGKGITEETIVAQVYVLIKEELASQKAAIRERVGELRKENRDSLADSDDYRNALRDVIEIIDIL